MSLRVIALEEHFWTPALRDLRRGVDTISAGRAFERLSDLGDLRLREMDEAGIDMQVMSEAEPATHNLEPALAVSLARESNDFLFEAVKRHPDRFAGFATLPAPDPQAAASELDRAVTKLGFRGAMWNGSTHGRFPDARKFRAVFEVAQAHDVPVYLHPSTPLPAVLDAYFKDYPALSRASLGFTHEVAVQAMRLVLSGIFDELPRLKIVLGHMGEALPFLLWRSDDTLKRTAKLKRSFREYFTEHFYITTAGNFSQPALQCTIAEMGIARVLFSVDWPFQPNGAAVDFMKKAALSEADRAAIFGGNARALLKL